MLYLIEESRKHIRIACVLLLLLSVITFINIINTSKTSALSGSEFKPGKIIDDAVFNNKSSMSAGQIQEFLNAKVPSCDTNGTQMYNSTQTRAQWAAANGRPAPPYTCLRDYSQNIPSVINSGSDLCKSSINGGVKSSAQIILDVSQACNINPQVLIVLLQKEQSLVSDTWPWPNQYQAATGYGCPDTAPCDAEYYGFFNQVYQAAKAFRRYEANPNSFNYKSNRNNNIYFNPNLSGCGSSNVFIENQATASLYIYTPYQPNAAALNNLYGTGDSCSAYGNRNFWRMFNDWFGPTDASVHLQSLVSQNAYTDSSKTTPLDLQNLRPGQRAFVTFSSLNTGNVSWGNTGNHPVLVGTTGPVDRPSILCDSTWFSCNRPTTLEQAHVSFGQIGSFGFWINAPSEPGTYTEHFSLLVQNYRWMNDVGMNFSIKVSSGQANDWQVNGLAFYTDSSKITPVNTAQLPAGSEFYTEIKLKNIGNNDWSNDNSTPIKLGTKTPQDRNSVICHQSWESCNRASRMTELSVRTGQTGTFGFMSKAPSTLGVINEQFGVLEEGVTWMQPGTISLYFQTTHGSYNWSIVSQEAFTDITESTPMDISTMLSGQRSYIKVKVRNNGATTWIKNQNAPNLGTNVPHDRNSKFCDATWISCTRAASMQEQEVKAGEIATYKYWIKSPYSSGSYVEHFKLVVEGYSWLNENAMNFSINVPNSSLTWQVLTMYAYTDSSKTVPLNLSTLTVGQRAYVGFTAKNTGNVYWQKMGSQSVRVGTNVPHDRNSPFCDATWLGCSRPALMAENQTAPGEIATFEFWMKAPSTKGQYTEHFKLLSESVAWFNENSLNYSIGVN